MYKHSKLFAVIAFVGLTGFLFPDANEEVAQFLRDTRTQENRSHKPDLPPKPELQPYVPVKYTGENKDPFVLQNFVIDATITPDDSSPEYTKAEEECKSAECADAAPDFTRPKYFLEEYDLESLNMVGTMRDRNHAMTVLISTPNEGIQKTRVGEFMGRNYGQIIGIHGDHIVIQEKYKVPRGWQNRVVTKKLTIKD